MTQPNVISIDGQDYIKAPAPVTGNRAIVVLDRGWIVVGHRTEKNGEVTLTECHNLRRWGSGGFGGVTKDPKGSEVELDEMADTKHSRGAEIMFVPIPEDWNA